MTAQALTLKNLCKDFLNTTVLHPLNITIPEGSFTSILGPSGCGKSTLLRLLCGLEKPTQGQIFLGNRDITNQSIEKRGIGMVFQNYALFPNLTVAQNITYGLHHKSKKEQDERLYRMLHLVDLPHLAHRYPHELSGGQQQRVAIARALAPQPRILLLDEPLSALDAWSRNAIGEELRNIQRQAKVTAIMVTHDRTEALSLSDYLIVLHQGQLADFGTPQRVYQNPKSAFSATFVGDMNVLRYPAIRDGKTTGIRFGEVQLSEANEQTLLQPHTFVCKVQRIQFLGDGLRVEVLLQDFRTKITAHLPRHTHTWLHEGLLCAVTLPEKHWCIW